MSNTQVAERGDIRTTLMTMEPQFAMALPPHIPAERFMRVVLTAVNGNPDLAKADKVSLFEAAMKAAQDGLLPDGRDGAFVIFRSKMKRGNVEEWVNKVQWMPMIGGILKKVRNSGELMSISAYVVYSNDKFTYRLGDDEKIEHEPALDEPGEPRLVYAIAHVKGGGVYREVMTLAQVQKVRNVSRAKDSGPWVSWWDEMARKTVLKRLAKRLPTSADLDDLLRRDDDLYDFKGQRAEAAPFNPVKHPLKDREPEAIEHDAGGGDQQQDVDGGASQESEASLVISKDGVVTKFRGYDLILDHRFQDPKFDTLAEWRSECETAKFPCQIDDEGNLTNGTADQPRQSAAEAAKSAAGDKGTEAPAGKESAQAASGGPATDNPAPKVAKAAKPYTDGGSYVTWITAQLAAAKTKTALKDVWGATRADRQQLCSTKQIEELNEAKEHALEAMSK